MAKVRIDKLIFEKGMAPSRERAHALIMAGCVLVNEVPVTKSGQLVNEEAVVRITGQDHPYVGRGGVKLAHALKEFRIDVKGKACVDVGASTGGFTDCLLQNGAAKVYAIDVGYNQIDWKLRNDPRVVVMEKVNIRDVAVTPTLTLPPRGGGEGEGKTHLPELVDIAVIDVSFISLTKVLPHVDKLLQNGGDIVALIKPQFEAGRGRVGKGGIVRDEKVREECVDNVMTVADGLKWFKNGLTKSPITGADGNVEFLAWWVKR